MNIVFLFPLRAQSFLTRDQALDMYFPGALTEKNTLYLDDGQVRKIQELARSKVPSKLVPYVVCREADRVVGYAFFDAEVIRTQKVAYMIALGAEGKVRAMEILAFYEPDDYRPTARWMKQFDEKGIGDDLTLRRGIAGISGATLSAQVLTDAVRRTLAIYVTCIHKD